MQLFIDGYTLGSNPSQLGGGFCVTDNLAKIVDFFEIRKEYFTNNEAEIRALWSAAVLAKENDEIFTDSLNSISWFKNGYSKSRPDLNEFLRDLKYLIEKKKLVVKLCPRSENWAGIYLEKLSTGLINRT